MKFIDSIVNKNIIQNLRSKATVCEQFQYSNDSTLTLILLTWRIWWAPNNASRWQMGFNSAFKGI